MYLNTFPEFTIGPMSILLCDYNVFKCLVILFSLAINSTFIVQCLKDQEPFRLLRFMSRHVDDNGLKYFILFIT